VLPVLIETGSVEETGIANLEHCSCFMCFYRAWTRDTAGNSLPLAGWWVGRFIGLLLLGCLWVSEVTLARTDCADTEQLQSRFWSLWLFSQTSRKDHV